MAGQDRTTTFFYWAAIALAAVGLFLRFAWPQGDEGAAAGYALTIVAIVLCVVVARRSRD